MASFRSNEEFFKAVGDLVDRLEASGHQQAAVRLRDGFRCLNGLTDGWALFLDAIEGVQATASDQFEHKDRLALETIRAAVHNAVYRR